MKKFFSFQKKNIFLNNKKLNFIHLYKIIKISKTIYKNKNPKIKNLQK